jgi:Bacterial Ig domain
MRTLSSLYIFLVVLTCAAQSQTQQTISVPSPTPYSIVQRSANSRIWQQTTYEQLPSGQKIPHVHQYTEMASGLCYQKDGQWVDSKEQISILPDGTAAATNGQHQVYFPGDIYNGVITLITSDGLQMQSRPLGLSYDDGTNTVLIAELTNSVGQLIGENEVIYTNAFAGISADLLYTYKKGGFEQDVIFREQPPTAEQCGLNSAISRLQLLTEFFNTASPVESTAVVNGQDGLQDTTLTFGSMTMVHGRAFLTGNGNTQSRFNSISVNKSWTVVDDRTLLVEETPCNQINPALKTLPLSTSPRTVSHSSNLYKISSKRILPVARGIENTATKIQLARLDSGQKPGVVFDYITVGSAATNFTFQGDMTYYISDEFDLSGTNIFEGGTVIKCNGSGILHIMANGAIDCLTGPYRPAVFTSWNDNTVGEGITGSSGAPDLSDVTWGFFQIDGSTAAVHDMRFSYGWIGLYENSDTTITVRNSQFFNVLVPLFSHQVNIYNSLIGYSTNEEAEIQENQYPEIWIEGSGLVAENVTADSGYALINADNSGEVLSLTNCLITSQLFTNADNGATLMTNAVVYLPAPSVPVYQVVGGGNYYLTNGSPYRSYGTTNVDLTLFSDLAKRTTWPPVVYDGTNISGLATLSPAVPRDISSTPDLGYHYDPLDYVFGGCNLNSNLTFTAGTAVGWFEDGSDPSSGQPYGILLNAGANLSFNGNATQPCYFSRFAMAQEGANGNWLGSGWMGAIIFAGSSPIPQLSANFTKWTDNTSGNIFRDTGSSADGAAGFLNCEFYGGGYNGGISTYEMSSLYFTNCLFFRSMINLWDSPNFTLENCTFYNGSLDMDRSTPVFWLIENSSFDGTAINWSDAYGGSSANTLMNYNAYNTNNLSWQTYPWYPPYNGTNEVVGTSDVMVTNFNWQTSWFGNFYLPTNSLILQMGSTNANQLGLYHFTTQTNQIVNGTNIVDIGYHYVATDQYGNPLDSNGNGIPDYLEDSSGRGILGPQITLITPITGASYPEPATIPLLANVTDWSSTVTNVNLLHDAVTITEIPAQPYSYSWPIVAAGSYSLTGIAQDLSGLSATSSIINVTITNFCSY